MHNWIRRLYKVLLGPDGKIENIDDFIVIPYYNKVQMLDFTFVKKQNITIDCEKYVSLKEFIQQRIDKECRDG